MKAKIAFAEDGPEVVPDLGFSQATPQGEPLRKSKICVRNSVSSVVAAGGLEPLISKPKVQRIDEKTSDGLGSVPAHLEAIQSLTKMELRARYKSEATAHRNMKGRAKSKGAVIHPEFNRFEDFLRHVGPCPANKATVDRIDNDDPEYAPGKVRWADKRTQNGNKGDTLVFYSTRTGESFTTSRLAKLQRVTPNTIRSRHQRGWSDDEIIEGRRGTQCHPQLASVRKTRRQTSTTQKPIHRTEDAGQVLFLRDAEYCQFIRETEGAEYFLATPKEMGRIDPKHFTPTWVKTAWKVHMTRRLPEWWKRYKPHVRFNDLKPFQQRLIRQIDPTI
ncbi:hypothetical protein [Tabrizicola sp.]|uniref:hypothetical protein n=1 Tax=Tabrizicola sp. TaxID=2005166 RepID=UPI001A4E5D8F|nr:hypothetical protein [Tabrizicola sp.]MBL9062601.1 hypothetical protein [Tabrizicola sp.]